MKERLNKIAKKKPIYEFFEKNEFIKGKFHKAESNSAKVFYSEDSTDEKSTLKKIFEITEDYFDKQFKKVTEGKGNELKHILQLNSSALAALLCFYRVKEHPIEYEIDGHKFTFNKVKFEKKNKVFSNRYPSCIDVALYDDNQNVVLFLESKFSEYFSTAKAKTGKSYKKYYDKISDKIKNANNIVKLKDFNFSTTEVSCNSKTHYCGGIKQMVSHYLGAKNYYEEPTNKEVKVVYLGTILFDFGGEYENAKSELDDYKDCYKELAVILNALELEENSEKKVTVLTEAITYQDLFSFSTNKDVLNENVKNFYLL